MKYFPLVPSALIVASAYAPTAAAACSGRICENVYITRIVTADNYVSIQTSGDEANLTCSGGGGYLDLNPAAANYKEIYSHILTMHVTRSIANIRLDDTNPDCVITYLYSDH